MILRWPFVRRADYDAACQSIRQLEENVRDARARATASDAFVVELRERIADWKGVAIETSKVLHEATARHSGELTAAIGQHHELAMHPPTGILTGPSVVSPIDVFGEKTREAIQGMSAGLSQRSRDAMIAAALRLKATNRDWDDETLARRVMEGERSPTS